MLALRLGAYCQTHAWSLPYRDRRQTAAQRAALLNGVYLYFLSAQIQRSQYLAAALGYALAYREETLLGYAALVHGVLVNQASRNRGKGQ